MGNTEKKNRRAGKYFHLIAPDEFALSFSPNKTNAIYQHSEKSLNWKFFRSYKQNYEWPINHLPSHLIIILVLK